MKKLFMLLATATIVFFNVNASVSGIEVAQKGDVGLGIMLGAPPASHANMPTVSIDAAWVLTSGFINTKTFGQNGAVDLGFYYGFTSYGWNSWNTNHNTVQNCALARSSFHFQFVEKLDTYAGMFAGVNLWAWSWSDNHNNKDNGIDSKPAFGPFMGAKYYFSEKFGVKMEFAHDAYEDHNVPNVSVGITFKF